MIRLRLLKSNSINFNMLCLFIFTRCTNKQFMGFLTMKLWEGVADAFRLFFSEFSLFCQKVDFFHPLNWNDDLKESESESKLES